MKKIFCLLASSIMVCALALAEPDAVTVAINTTGAAPTNTATTTAQLSGRLVAIDFTLSGTTGTNHVTVAAGNQTFFSLTNLISSGIYYPRIQTHNTSGIALGVATNHYEAPIVVREKVTVTAHGDADDTTNSITARIILE